MVKRILIAILIVVGGLAFTVLIVALAIANFLWQIKFALSLP